MNSLSAVHGLYDGLYTVCTVCMMVGMCALRPVKEGFWGVHLLLRIHAAEMVEQATAVFCCPPLRGEGQNRFVLDMTLNCRLPHREKDIGTRPYNVDLTTSAVKMQIVWSFRFHLGNQS